MPAVLPWLSFRTLPRALPHGELVRGQVPATFSDVRDDLGTADLGICSVSLCRFTGPVEPAVGAGLMPVGRDGKSLSLHV